MSAPPIGHNAAIAALRDVFGDRLSTSDAVREQHGRGEDYFPMAPPDAVAFALTTEEVSAAHRICAEFGLPVIPFGTGTSLEGHVSAVQGGLSIDLSRMNEVLEVNGEDSDCRVQAGVTRKQLNEYLRDTGLFFPIDPGADASLGGMAATGASGTNAVRYGTMSENILGLTVVMSDGEIVETGGRARKSSAGYDLTRLFIGSEGTLCTITEVRLKLYGIPESIASAVCQFPDLEAAVDTVTLTMQSGVPVARIELLDDTQMDACIRYSDLEDFEVRPTLFFEFHGSPAGTAEQAETVEGIAGELGGSAFRWTRNQEERNKLWQARHDVYYACMALRPGCRAWSTDVCVPISRLAECLIETRRDVDETGLIAPIVGHVGDGNFHCGIVLDPDDPEEMATAQAFNKRLVARALAMGGTCTGEHGVGQGKIDSVEAERGEAVDVMRALKSAIDPENRMNPGKVIRL